MEVINKDFKTVTQNLSIMRDLNHDYIRMNIDFSGVDHVRITQYQHNFLEDILDETNNHYEGMRETSVTPAVSDVFTINALSPFFNTGK